MPNSDFWVFFGFFGLFFHLKWNFMYFSLRISKNPFLPFLTITERMHPLNTARWYQLYFALDVVMRSVPLPRNKPIWRIRSPDFLIELYAVYETNNTNFHYFIAFVRKHFYHRATIESYGGGSAASQSCLLAQLSQCAMSQVSTTPRHLLVRLCVRIPWQVYAIISILGNIAQ